MDSNFIVVRLRDSDDVELINTRYIVRVKPSKGGGATLQVSYGAGAEMVYVKESWGEICDALDDTEQQDRR